MAVEYDKILALYIERISGTISEEDAAFLDKQLSSNADVQQIWTQIEEEANDADLQLFMDGVRPQQSLQELKERLQMNENPAENRGVTVKQLFSRISIAAAIVLLFGAGWICYNHTQRITDTQKIATLVGASKQVINLQLSSGKTVYLNATSPQKLAVGNTVLDVTNQSLQIQPADDTTTNILNIPNGENYQITLSDGTEVILNASSSLKFPFRFGRTTREVYLTGEAYFKVAKDKAHPFIVHTPLTQVQVVGTEFNINTYEPGKVSTALVEGKVLTKAAEGTQIPLTPGHAAIYSTTTGFNVKPVDTDDVLSWVKGVYYFHDLTVHSLAEKMARIYNVDVKIENSKVAGKSVSGIMDRDKLPELLEDLRTTMGIKYYYAGNKLHIE